MTSINRGQVHISNILTSSWSNQLQLHKLPHLGLTRTARSPVQSENVSSWKHIIKRKKALSTLDHQNLPVPSVEIGVPHPRGAVCFLLPPGDAAVAPPNAFPRHAKFYPKRDQNSRFTVQFILLILRMSFLCIPGWTRTHRVSQVSLSCSASAAQVLLL